MLMSVQNITLIFQHTNTYFASYTIGIPTINDSMMYMKKANSLITESTYVCESETKYFSNSTK